MTTIDNLRAQEQALLADRARVDERLRDVRAAMAGAEALAAEARERVAEKPETEQPEEG